MIEHICLPGQAVAPHQGKAEWTKKGVVCPPRPLKSPQPTSAPVVSMAAAAAVQPEVPVLCAAVHLGFDTGQSDQSYANGNQMGRESPVDYRRRREAYVFTYPYAERSPALPPRSSPSYRFSFFCRLPA